MQETKKTINWNILILSFLFALLTLAVSTYFFLANKKSKELQNYQRSNPVGYIKQDEKTTTAFNLYNAGDYPGAFSAFEAVAKDEPQKEVRESLYLYAASSLFLYDKPKAIQYYYSIYSDTSYSKQNRAYALLKVYFQAIGEDNLAYLQPFLAKPDQFSSMTRDEVYYEISQNIYNLYPYAPAAVRMERIELANATSTGQAKAIHDKYKDAIIKSRAEMLGNEGLRHYVANTVLGEFLISKELEKYKISTPDQTQALIDLAYTTAKLNSPVLTQQYAALYYADYSAQRGDIEKSLSLLAAIQAQGVKEVIKVNLSKEQSHKDYKTLYELSKKDPRFTAIFKPLGW